MITIFISTTSGVFNRGSAVVLQGVRQLFFVLKNLNRHLHYKKINYANFEQIYS